MTYDWAAYKRQERAHHRNNHANCDPRMCRDREEIEWHNTVRLHARALLDILGSDAREFLGDRYEEICQLAEVELPEWLESEPSIVHRLRAKGDIEDGILSI